MMVSKTITRFVLGGVLTALSIGVSAAPSNPRTTIRHIESHGDYAVITLSRAIVNDTSCYGRGDYTLANTNRIDRFHINIDAQRNNYVLIMTAAASRKRAQFTTSGCGSETRLPSITNVDVRF